MRTLNELETYVIEQKGTERPFSGEYCHHDGKGVYCCKRCDAALYLSEHKFQAHCGWPAFDDELPGAVTRHPDADGRRTEIVCSSCGGHLGHVFEGEFLTPKNLRHCVNSVSLVFKPDLNDDLAGKPSIAESKALATFGGGCFWCSEALYSTVVGVERVIPGYAGGLAKDADYQSVCSGRTGHAEVIQIEYDQQQVSFATLLQAFFQSHDPTTLNRQGNDVGSQYRSVIFAHDEHQARLARDMIAALTESGVYHRPIVTEVLAFDGFYPAEDHHQQYFTRHGEQAYCQYVIKPKLDKFKQTFAKLLKTSQGL